MGRIVTVLAVELLELGTLLMEHFVELFGARFLVLLVFVDQKRTQDELIEALEVVGARGLSLSFYFHIAVLNSLEDIVALCIGS